MIDTDHFTKRLRLVACMIVALNLVFAFFVSRAFFLVAIVLMATLILSLIRREPTAADAAFTPSRDRWQAVVVTGADKRGRPTQRRTLHAESSQHLDSMLLDYYGYIESAGLYEFRRRTILGFSCGAIAEMTQPLLVNPSALYLAEAEAWRQKQERTRS